jgi:hypothetical protein
MAAFGVEKQLRAGPALPSLKQRGTAANND